MLAIAAAMLLAATNPIDSSDLQDLPELEVSELVFEEGLDQGQEFDPGQEVVLDDSLVLDTDELLELEE